MDSEFRIQSKRIIRRPLTAIFLISLLAGLMVLLVLEIRFRQQRVNEIVASQAMHLMAGYSGFMHGGILDIVAQGANPAPAPVEDLLAKGSISIKEGNNADIDMKKDSQIGHFKPDDEMYFWWFRKNGKIVHENRYHLNNYGLISHYDYSIERTEASFRILVLGDELTAATTADKSWPDYLQEILNRDSGFTRHLGAVEVINFGWPDAGFHVMSRVWLKKAQKFKPDLVILNFAEHSFVRMPNPPQADKVPNSFSLKKYTEPFEAQNGLRAWMLLLCYDDDRRLRDLGCLVGRPFALFLPKKLARDADALAAVQDLVIHEYLGRLIWNDWRPTFLLNMLGDLDDPLAARIDKGSQNRASLPPPTADQKLENARSNIAKIRSSFRNLLILQSRNYAELVPSPTERPLSDSLRAKNPEFRIVDMKDFLPLNSGQIKSWFQVPFAAEKWSNAGHKLYAQVAANVVRLRLQELGVLPAEYEH